MVVNSAIDGHYSAAARFVKCAICWSRQAPLMRGKWTATGNSCCCTGTYNSNVNEWLLLYVPTEFCGVGWIVMVEWLGTV